MIFNNYETLYKQLDTLEIKKKWISILEMKNKFRMNIILYGHELCIFLALSLSTTVVVNYGTNKYMLGI